jgi:putative addiction module component (TIGR02574 family)
MSPVLDRIEKEAFQLSPLEREKLATHLFYSVHPVLTDVDEAWLDLADRRYQDLVSGKTSPLSEEEFFSSVEKELGWS